MGPYRQEHADTRGYYYVNLIRMVYWFANTATSSKVSTYLLRMLATNLKEEILTFFAGVWLTDHDQSVRLAALRHAKAFLDAHSSSKKPVDFQTILPAFLAALPALDAAGREAVMDCVDILGKLAEIKPSSIYGIDTIYGDKSSERHLHKPRFH
jgi:U3 small nucleolar RNA-associated protein 10